jgi:enoyl-CoA hydratase/carnithine racemase
MDFKNVKISVDEAVAVLSLARVKSLNALNLALAGEMVAAVGELGAREDVRAIVLKSEAAAFSAGLDLKDILSLGFDGSARSALGFPERLKALFDCCNALESCPKPVIAAVNGMCIGGGLDIICACDIRVCTEDASFSLREAAIGLVADMGVLQRLPLIVGQGFAREMAYTARFYTAREAERMGLVHAVYPGREEMESGALKLAREIAGNAPLAVKATKEVLNFSRYVSVEEGMALAISRNMVLLNSQDMGEAVSAFLEKRKPAFQGK